MCRVACSSIFELSELIGLIAVESPVLVRRERSSFRKSIDLWI